MPQDTAENHPAAADKLSTGSSQSMVFDVWNFKKVKGSCWSRIKGWFCWYSIIHHPIAIVVGPWVSPMRPSVGFVLHDGGRIAEACIKLGYITPCSEPKQWWNRLCIFFLWITIISQQHERALFSDGTCANKPTGLIWMIFFAHLLRNSNRLCTFMSKIAHIPRLSVFTQYVFKTQNKCCRNMHPPASFEVVLSHAHCFIPVPWIGKKNIREKNTRVCLFVTKAPDWI